MSYRRSTLRRRSAVLEILEDRRLLSVAAGVTPWRMIGVSGNQQNDAYEDETLYEITPPVPGTTEGFVDVGNPPDTILSVVTDNGVSHGSSALRVETPQFENEGDPNPFWGFRSPNVAEQLRAGVTTLSYDLTLINRQLNGGDFGGGADDSFNGYAQSNELAVVIPATGAFIQRNFTTGNATDSMGLGAQWSGRDGTRTITWDLTTFTAPNGQSLAQYLAANNATEAYFWFVTQGDDTNGNVGPMRFFWDNFALSGPTETDPVRVFGDFEGTPMAVTKLLNLPHVPDTDAIGFNPETGLLHRVSGTDSYRNDPQRIAYHDNQFMETIDVYSPNLTQVGVFNANYEGDNDRGTPTGNYGLPAPRPTWTFPDHRRTDEETDPSFGETGPNEYNVLRDLTWSAADHAFIGTDEDGEIFKLTADGQSTRLGNSLIGQGGPKGIAFFIVNDEMRLLVSERGDPDRGSNLWSINPETGEVIGDPIPLVDAEGNPIPGLLSLVATPDGATLYGIGKSVADPANAFVRELVQINPETGLVTYLGQFGLHMADLAIVTPRATTPTQVTQVFVNGQNLTANAAFRGAGGMDQTFGYPVPAGPDQTRALPWLNGINAVSLRFSQDVTGQIDQGDLAVRGSGGNLAVSNFTYDAATRTATWTLAAPVTQDKVRLVLDDALVGGLDGEWNNGSDTYPSGDNSTGGDFDFRFNVLRGDATGDGQVNALDLADVKRRLNRRPGDGVTGAGAYSIFADITMDGQINALDLAAVKQRLNTRLPSTDPALLLAGF